jgi:Amt family ammonium transporter
MSHLINNLPLIIQDAAAVESLAGAIKDDMGMLWMLLSGILVFFMQAGFTLVESGMTRSKNAVNIAMKNLLDIAVGSLTYWFVGYSLMYGDTSNGWFFWSGIMQGEVLTYSSKQCLQQLQQQLFLGQLQEEQNTQLTLYFQS